MAIIFTVPGAPVAKARPRFRAGGGRGGGHAYTPKPTARYEALVRQRCMQAMREAPGGGSRMLEGPVEARICAMLPVPKSAGKGAGARMEGMRHAKRPDADNLAKAVLDALNGVAYRDDGQVSVLRVAKLYSGEPRVSVRLSELGPG